MNPLVRHALLVFVGILVVQAAWVLAVPPFRGSDEFDHAYRAAGVASGQWTLDDVARDGRGWVVEVPSPLVTAAGDQCSDLAYTRRDNCQPIDGTVDDGRASVATAAGLYNPGYYWVVGTAARPFEGTASLYAMRAVSAVLCALFIAVAWAALAGVAGGWTWLSFVATLTPVLIYSTAIVAPNGLEMAAGLCLWACILALGRERSPTREPWLVGSAAAAAAVLLNLRMLGPLWLLLLLGVALFFVGWRQPLAAVRTHRLWAISCAAFVGAAALTGIGWTIGSGLVGESADEGPTEAEQPPFTDALKVHLWILQLVAAFPYRDQPAPMAVYPLVLIVVGALLVVGIRRSSGGQRAALILGVVLTLVVPLAVTAGTMSAHGVLWQGRYALPFVVGIPLCCGLVLDDRRWRIDDQRGLTALAMCMLVSAQCLSVAAVLEAELKREVSKGDPHWVHPSSQGVLVAITVVAFLVLTLSRSTTAKAHVRPPRVDSTP